RDDSPDANVAIFSERVGAARGAWLVEQQARLPSAVPALDHRGGRVRPGCAAPSHVVHGWLQQGAGECATLGAQHRNGTPRLSSAVTARRATARADAEGAAPFLP